jgi:hypothetical protein
MKKNLLLILFLISLSAVVGAQTPSDAIMMKQGQSCFALTYDMGSWDHYWEGADLRVNGNVGTLSRNMVMPMIAIGLHDKLNLIIAAPYIKTESKEPNGGYLHGAKGFQDLGLSLKGELLKKAFGPGKLSVLATAGFSTPISNYLSDYMPYSLGFGANELSLRGIVQYRMENGLYVQTSLAHLWRGQTEIERDYYYNNGSYYTNKMDVPNAWTYNAAVGIWLLKSALKLEVNYVALNSTSGDDIRKYNAGQPTNKAEFGQVGFAAQYYIKQARGLGVQAYYSKFISGRNMGEFSNLGVGVTYQFTVKAFSNEN